MIKTIDPTSLQMVRRDIDAALKVIGDHHGISLATKGTASYTSQNFKVQVEAAVKVDGGDVFTREASAFLANATLYGLKPEHLFGETMYATKRVKIIGLNTRKHRFPILVQDVTVSSDGRRMYVPSDAIARSVANWFTPKVNNP